MRIESGDGCRNPWQSVPLVSRFVCGTESYADLTVVRVLSSGVPA